MRCERCSPADIGIQSCSREWRKVEMCWSCHIYRMISNKWWQYKYLFKISAPDCNTRLDWASEIGYIVKFYALCQIIYFFKLFNHDKIVIHSLSLLCFRSQHNGFWSYVGKNQPDAHILLINLFQLYSPLQVYNKKVYRQDFTSLHTQHTVCSSWNCIRNYANYI